MFILVLTEFYTNNHVLQIISGNYIFEDFWWYRKSEVLCESDTSLLILR